MMTPEQHKEIIDFLHSKKLPLDLLVEVDDHMKEEISALMDEGTPFENAFNQVKINWQNDLEMKFAFFRGKITKLEKESFREMDRNKNWTALKIFAPYFFITIFSTIYNPILGKYIIISGNFIIGLYSAFLMIAHYKLFKSASKSYMRRNISILQRKVSLLVLGAQGLFVCLLDIDRNLARFQSAITHFPQIKVSEYLSIVFPFLYIYAGIIGILYINDYKKTVKILKQKINFKL